MRLERNLKLDTTNNEQLRVACEDCGRETNHKVLRSVEVEGHDVISREFDVDWNVWYQIIECQGCSTVSFRRASENSIDSPFVDENGDAERNVEEKLFPPRDFGRKELADLEYAPERVQTIYRETLRAINGDQPVLAGIGIRALIETVCKAKRAKGHTLYHQIDNLVVLGILSKDGAKTLHKLRVLGNKAAHEVRPHSPKQLSVAIDVVDHLIQGVYILPKRAKHELTRKRARKLARAAF